MKTQTITRKDLGKLIKDLKISPRCKWNNTIQSVLNTNHFEDVFDIPEDLIRDAFSDADLDQKELLCKYFNTVNTSIIDRTPTLESALALGGLTLEKIERVHSHFPKWGEALFVIKAVAKVLNEGWTPDFSNTSQRKYYPYLEYKGSKLGWVWCYCSFYVDDSCGPVAYYKSEEIAKHAWKLLEPYYNTYLNQSY